MISRKSYEIASRYSRETAAYKSTVSDTARRIGLKIAKRRVSDRVGIQQDIALLQNDLIWLGQHHLPRAYVLGHGRLREDPRAPVTVRQAVDLNTGVIQSKFIPAVRQLALNATPNADALRRLENMLENEDPEQIERELRRRGSDDAEAVALLALLAMLSGIDDPEARRSAGLSNITVGIGAATIAVGIAGWAASLAGRYWATIWQGKKDKVELEHNGEPMPVKRVLDPGAKHCETCPPKAGVYESWAEMLSACGGYPGDGSDACFSSCKCELWEWDGKTWVLT